MKTGSIIILAWPDAVARQVGHWYDTPANWLGISKKGYYKVGHAAAVLVNHETGSLHYFDFGRYHTPEKHGRVRDHETDHDLSLPHEAELNDQQDIVNIRAILQTIANNPACHGDGRMLASIYKGIHFEAAYDFAKGWQAKGTLPYGPFSPKATNCSRFITSLIKAGKVDIVTRFFLTFPYTLSPTPGLNVVVANSYNSYMIVQGQQVQEKRNLGDTLLFPKAKLEAPFVPMPTKR